MSAAEGPASWISVTSGPTSRTDRLAVPGGHIYRTILETPDTARVPAYAVALVFVPSPPPMIMINAVTS